MSQVQCERAHWGGSQSSMVAWHLEGRVLGRSHCSHFWQTQALALHLCCYHSGRGRANSVHASPQQASAAKAKNDPKLLPRSGGGSYVRCLACHARCECCTCMLRSGLRLPAMGAGRP